ncbi:hypothetical protein EDB84DRAFT_1436143 [Lactarius hengduanensis]|nr:hypothetical protein EDB84DRAFT_1436143 [Lactarius hengduanensis]
MAAWFYKGVEARPTSDVDEAYEDKVNDPKARVSQRQSHNRISAIAGNPPVSQPEFELDIMPPVKDHHKLAHLKGRSGITVNALVEAVILAAEVLEEAGNVEECVDKAVANTIVAVHEEDAEAARANLCKQVARALRKGHGEVLVIAVNMLMVCGMILCLGT